MLKKSDQPLVPIRWTPQPESVDRSKVEAVRKIAMPFGLTDDDNDDFADLLALTKLIGNANIVQLGEQSHGDGACFQAKVRLVKFPLVTRLGLVTHCLRGSASPLRKAWQFGRQSLQCIGLPGRAR